MANKIIGTALVLTVVAMEAVVTDALVTMETAARRIKRLATRAVSRTRLARAVVH